ncbi:Ig-like domain-containing protein [Hafnia alvei]|uniref:Ig-like domain-containing protein n=1 Tax=Proteus vulgaris TaxID=585 RepID=UPI00299E76A6|nr:Ig-like domain-containing protein [Proteus vulgaris]WOO48608.1 Ig-like domain-containing protein [Hafnia alvei]WPF03072.1 Ig-like domain-containing protein [Proteus vulgaris]
MAQCPEDKGNMLGDHGILRIAKGCPSQVPDQSSFMRFGAVTSKSLDYGMETVNSNADDTPGLSEAIVTGADLTISVDGEMRVTPLPGSTSAMNFAKELLEEIQARRQTGYWVQLDMRGDGKEILQGYFNFTSWSMEFPTRELATYSGELKVHTATTVEWLTEEIAVESISVDPSATTVKVGETKSIMVKFTPGDATNKTCTAVSDKPAFATVSQVGTVVTARGVATGVANVTITSEDGAKTAKCVVTVTE